MRNLYFNEYCTLTDPSNNEKHDMAFISYEIKYLYPFYAKEGINGTCLCLGVQVLSSVYSLLKVNHTVFKT